MKISLLRAVLCSVWLFWLVLFLAPLARNINIGSIAGGVFFLLLIAVTLFPGRFSDMISKLNSNTAGRMILICLSALTAAGVIAASVISVLMIKSVDDPPPEKNVTVIVAGCRVNGDRPTLMLSKRIKAAYEYLTENPDAVCIASGGQGSDENISEAVCIKRELCRLGISEERIFCEDRSTSTRENLRYSAELLESMGLPRRAVIVTSEYHQYRAGMIAEKLGFEVYSRSAKTAWYLLPVCWVREWFGVIYELIFRKI